MSAPPIRVRFQFTRRDAVAELWEFIGRRWALAGVPVVLLALGALLWMETAWRGTSWTSALLRCAWLPLVAALAAHHVFRRLPRRAFDALPADVRDATWELEFDEQRIGQSRGGASGQTSWAVWARWSETPGFVRLFPPATGAGKARLAIPKRAFATPDDLQALRALLQRKLPAPR